MKCQECGLELMLYQVSLNTDGQETAEYVCRNPRCGCYDRRLKRKPDTDTPPVETDAQP